MSSLAEISFDFGDEASNNRIYQQNYYHPMAGNLFLKQCKRPKKEEKF